MAEEGVLDRQYAHALETVRHYEKERVKLVYQIYFFLIAVIFTTVSQGIAMQADDFVVQQSFVFWLYLTGSVACLLLGLVTLSVFGMVRNWTVRIAEAETEAEFLRAKVLGGRHKLIADEVRDRCDQRNPDTWLFQARSTTDMLAFMPFIPALAASVWVAASAIAHDQVVQTPWHALALLVAPVYLIHFVSWNLLLPWAIPQDLDEGGRVMTHIGNHRSGYRIAASIGNVALFVLIAELISRITGMDAALQGGVVQFGRSLAAAQPLLSLVCVLFLIAYTYRTGHWMRPKVDQPIRDDER